MSLKAEVSEVVENVTDGVGGEFGSGEMWMKSESAKVGGDGEIGGS